jgi:hypothetical protein
MAAFALQPNWARRRSMKKNVNQDDGSTSPPAEPCGGQNETAQRIDLNTPAEGTCELGTAEIEAYLAHLVHLDLPLAVKIELIRALHRIMQSFVDRAFGDDPAQLACDAKGNPLKTDVRSED